MAIADISLLYLSLRGTFFQRIMITVAASALIRFRLGTGTRGAIRVRKI